MAVTEHYQTDVFAIIMLIACALLVVFLIIVAIYFFNLMNLKPPTKGESTFLFWITVILVLIFIGLSIYSLIRIFTHKSAIPIVNEDKSKSLKPTSKTLPMSVSQNPYLQETTPAPIKINNIPKTSRATTESDSFSDVPFTQKQRTIADEGLVSIVDITGGP